ncbi:CCT motif family protein [Dorcoceras hygrometricum]|uniref:CCT motif family protein n=1 Tax=Dorcoceras hygrometricum TaxID=472368 RepID=A0A2Z7ACK7_9LAMI|nr:CCT motif family protein [Dorcoceras hygrometricum]
MYAETELMFPHFQNFPKEVQQFDEFCCPQKPNTSMDAQGNLIPTSTISEYYLEGDGDLFKAPEPVIEEPVIEIDPVTAAIFCGENGIAPQPLTELDIESSIESGPLLNEVFYECQKDLLAKEGDETHLSEALSIMIPTVKTDENNNTDEKLLDNSSFQKSISSSCLSPAENVQEAPMKPTFIDSHVMDGALYGMRRSLSEGDLKINGDGDMNLGKSPLGQPISMSSCPSEDRMEKLSRYRSKKSRRNFGRKIKYACRKALADSQPRIRGRFAKIE